MPELIPSLSAVGEVERLGILVEGERAVRRFGLHRVAEGLQAGLSREELSREELTKLIESLLAASKARQYTFHNIPQTVGQGADVLFLTWLQMMPTGRVDSLLFDGGCLLFF